jgi:predicted  nucleic acid-binding Zn-ribbon protein
MALLEAADGELADLMARLSGIEDHMAAKREQLKIEQDSLLRSREDQEAERSAATGTIAPRVLQAYEALRKAKRGRAVAEIADNACAACGTILTAALQQSARHAIELVNCPSCGRILFAG